VRAHRLPHRTISVDRQVDDRGRALLPYKTTSAEERLWWYSRFFDVVEVNSTFYALLSPDSAALWVERTPPRFLFNVKAYGLLTGHHLDAARLPDPLRRMLSAATQDKRAGRVPNSSFGDEAQSWAFAERRKGLQPLRRSGKLGYGRCSSSRRG
jgi:uncharacterized protein YecE (DUF72 family)